MTEYWSWLLTAIGVAGLFLTGNKHRYGWAILVAGQFLWLAYAIQTHQEGFTFGAILFGAVYARNWMRWGKIKEDNN